MRWERNDKCAILISLWKSVFIKQSQRISPPLWPTCKCPILFAPITITAPVLAQWAKMRKKFYPLNLFLHWNKFPLILTIEENSALCIVLSKYIPNLHILAHFAPILTLPYYYIILNRVRKKKMLCFFREINITKLSWNWFHEKIDHSFSIFFVCCVNTILYIYLLECYT